MTTKYAGADWIRKFSWGANISPLGVKVSDLLGDVFAGIHHLDNRLLAKTDWSNNYFIVVQIDNSLSTFDPPHLTWLVVLAHDRLLRLQIAARSRGRVELMFHPRKGREGGISERHPTLEQHLDYIRRHQADPSHQRGKSCDII